MAITYGWKFSKDFGFSKSAEGRHDAMNHPADPDDNEYGDGSFVENRPALAKEKGMARGGRAKAKGYQMGGPADAVPTGRPTGVPGMGAAPGVAPAAGPMARAPAPMAPQQSPLAQGAEDGPLSHATMTMPVHDAARLAHGLVQAGRLSGVRQAIGNAAAARGAAMGRAPMGPAAGGSPVAAPPAPVAQQGIPAMAKGGRTKNFQPGGEKGKLHRELGVPEGQKIPAGRLSQAASSRNPEVRRDAIRAETMKKWHHGKK